jgi:hypothetical protein
MFLIAQIFDNNTRNYVPEEYKNKFSCKPDIERKLKIRRFSSAAKLGRDIYW